MITDEALAGSKKKKDAEKRTSGLQQRPSSGPPFSHEASGDPSLLQALITFNDSTPIISVDQYPRQSSTLVSPRRFSVLK